MFLVIERTKLGVAFRAVSSNPFACEVCGLNLCSVHLFSWIAGAGLGVLSALYLVFIELFRVDAVCIWCTGVHICTVALLVAILWRTSLLSSAITSDAVA